MQAWADEQRRAGCTIGLVPTMGALHEGHLSLVEAARRENDRVVVSLFVNPLQFAPGEDFERYPRRELADLALLQEEGVDAVYTPSTEEMYPPNATTRVQVRQLQDPLERAHRPGHFEGVATVVLKLFNAARPHRAYFGQKDAQQAALVTRMARDLDTGVEVRVLPIVREPDGLAKSSRNQYLTPEQRRAATVLHRALKRANDLYSKGERDPNTLKKSLEETLAEEPAAVPDYAELVDPESFLPPGPLAVLAVRFGSTRLIDNHRLGEPL